MREKWKAYNGEKKETCLQRQLSRDETQIIQLLIMRFEPRAPLPDFRFYMTYNHYNLKLKIIVMDQHYMLIKLKMSLSNNNIKMHNLGK